MTTATPGARALCWSCRRRAADPDSSAKVKLHGHVTSKGEWFGRGVRLLTSWQYVTVDIPRCRLCRRIQTIRTEHIALILCGAILPLSILLGGFLHSISRQASDTLRAFAIVSGVAIVVLLLILLCRRHRGAVWFFSLVLIPFVWTPALIIEQGLRMYANHAYGTPRRTGKVLSTFPQVEGLRRQGWFLGAQPHVVWPAFW